MNFFSTTKLGLLIFVVLIFTSTLVAVAAYSNTNVVSPAKIKIVSTSDAFLSLSSYNDPCNFVTTTGEGLLSFSFNFDNIYQQEFNFDELFMIKNNSADDVKLTIESEGIGYISIQPSNRSTFFVENGENRNNYYNLNSGEEITIKVSIDIPQGIPQSEMDGILRVKVEAR